MSIWVAAWGPFALDFFLRLFICLRVIQRRLPVGVTWAWLCLILFLPIVGTVLYLYLGEYRLGRHRSARLRAASEAVQSLLQTLTFKTIDESVLSEPACSFARAVSGFFHTPLLSGNDIELLPNAEESFRRMIADINHAKIYCDMEFFIWSNGGRADDFSEALIRAAVRGVRVRILVDQIGSSKFLRSAMATKLKKSGIQLRAALPAGVIRSFIARPDLRIHRKILIIDGAMGYTGSLNLADPLLFKRSAGVGQWVDAFCRVRGPAVEGLGFVFLSDWSVETKTDFLLNERQFEFQDIAEGRTAMIQVLPSGPAYKNSAIEEVLLMAIYSARKTLVLTTPYFVPTESMLYALVAAAQRGVRVTLVVPARVDSLLTQYTSRAFLKDLVEAGVHVALYLPGLLHTKSVVIDEQFSLFGSFNLDPRSLRINFEIGVAVYDDTFSHALSALQQTYIQASEELDAATCNAPSRWTQLKEDLARLTGPVL